MQHNVADDAYTFMKIALWYPIIKLGITNTMLEVGAMLYTNIEIVC